MRYGLIPELIGRLPVVAPLDGLEAADLRRILTEPKNALTKQYEKLFAMDGVELVFEDDALDAAVEKAIALKTGARGLRTVLEEAMLGLMFDAPEARPSTVIRVTRGVIEHGEAPVIEERSEAA